MSETDRLREALEREHYGHVRTHAPDFPHSHPGAVSDRCGICASKSECPTCSALAGPSWEPTDDDVMPNECPSCGGTCGDPWHRWAPGGAV